MHRSQRAGGCKAAGVGCSAAYWVLGAHCVPFCWYPAGESNAASRLWGGVVGGLAGDVPDRVQYGAVVVIRTPNAFGAGVGALVGRVG